MTEKNGAEAHNKEAGDRLYENWRALRDTRSLKPAWEVFATFCRGINRDGLEEDERVVAATHGMKVGPDNWRIVIGGPSAVSREVIEFEGKFYTIAGAAKFVGLGEQHTQNLNKQGRLQERMQEVSKGQPRPRMKLLTNEQIQKGLEVAAEVIDEYDFNENKVARESRKAVFEPLLDGQIRAIDATIIGYDSGENMRASILAYVRRERPDIRLKSTVRRSDGFLIIQSVPIDRPVEEPKPE